MLKNAKIVTKCKKSLQNQKNDANVTKIDQKGQLVALKKNENGT